MIKAYILVREDRHVDAVHWVFLDKDDALKAAQTLMEDWIESYDMDEGEINELDKECYGETIFSCNAEDRFTIYVQNVDIMEKGENEIKADA